ncbi:hypothetical protein F441_19803 [Phytophthora nicotianae CJ01A1]|uniref:Ubiquitin-protein ligase E3A N-terminal zinc-binding domain-containing protein n=4 Tax=Phytophthora nicotianae TaxID=4792 RepID=W2PJ75_PHYN3|nr:hypothetical protein PPTG_17886 [Phytophthora nicotianae INRA-310]ETI33375.1 hypothetical protein F443_19943 [Phytophthora nicotianae P1569]ETK73699.1 hypothetical protein L915_19403 [Phytophthora nicotianae]ETP03236.1 hypothetical protein F441_19803 [Phytophthora nicotianae CJ01A1]KUF98054.1 hypothetical protein AM587_10006579 [Phytophthora nicotianae]ETL27132.1 hypothetical protein L916_19296 [Phytophthora nicotianae]
MDQVDGAVVSASDYAYARQLVQAYFAMLTVGCHRNNCMNMYCCSNQTQALTATEAAIMSIYFATKAPVSLCIDIKSLQQEETLSTPEMSELPRHEKIKMTSTPEPQEVEENQTEENAQSSIEEHVSKEEVNPETPDEVPKLQQPEIKPVLTTSSPPKSTPRRRLSVAVQLDNGLNKNRELPVKRPTVITRVAVQPKQKSDIHVTPSISVTKVTDTLEQEQQQEQVAPKGARQLLSRPKQKLFDAIKRSFSRSKKTPLGST